MEIERTPLDLTLCLEEALDLFVVTASAKGLEIGYYIAPDVPTWIMGDVTRLRQVVVNLVNNAVKFTPKGSISVEVRRIALAAPAEGAPPPPEGAMALEFTVRDSGIGIPPEGIAGSSRPSARWIPRPRANTAAPASASRSRCACPS